jgi:hypothetical protein
MATAHSLSRSFADSRDSSRLGVTLAGLELTLGSLLHTLRVPFSGTFMSTLQGYILTGTLWSQHKQSGSSPNLASSASAYAAICKSLSPSGKRLTPMLAIATQGLLLQWPVNLLGVNFFSLAVGNSLIAIWSLFQPLLIFVGTVWISLDHKNFDQLKQKFGFFLNDDAGLFPVSPIQGLYVLIIFKVVVAIGITYFAMFGPVPQWLAIRLRKQHLDSVPTIPADYTEAPKKALAMGPLTLQAGSLLLKKSFLLPTTLVFFVLYLQTKKWDESALACARVVALTFLGHFLIQYLLHRTSFFQRWLSKIMIVSNQKSIPRQKHGVSSDC